MNAMTIVTRGLGSASSVVTQGFGGQATFVIAAVQRRATVGGSRYRRQEHCDPIVIWAKLITVNGVQPDPGVSGRTVGTRALIAGITVAAERIAVEPTNAGDVRVYAWRIA